MQYSYLLPLLGLPSVMGEVTKTVTMTTTPAWCISQPRMLSTTCATETYTISKTVISPPPMLSTECTTETWTTSKSVSPSPPTLSTTCTIETWTTSKFVSAPPVPPMTKSCTTSTKTMPSSSSCTTKTSTVSPPPATPTTKSSCTTKAWTRTMAVSSSSKCSKSASTSSMSSSVSSTSSTSSSVSSSTWNYPWYPAAMTSVWKQTLSYGNATAFTSMPTPIIYSTPIWSTADSTTTDGSSTSTAMSTKPHTSSMATWMPKPSAPEQSTTNAGSASQPALWVAVVSVAVAACFNMS
ncbi:hypothetical protein LTR62_002521 [Meristemomyces frigidus]|uniref:Uncharacterized protein n=1 Tax=Meristemomyces frigidus TaxID=1508187 RepID=A0AAN7YHH8_9PEZI|nr:hypothetical protein LTR62_002521 [Meristemomyces frigidus]